MPTIRETKDGKFVEDFLDPAKPEFVPLEETLNRLKSAEGNPHLLIHIHGGLVSTASGRLNAIKLATPLPNGIRDDAYEQLSVVWGSGALETVVTNFRELANERLFDRVLKKTLQWASRRVIDFGTGLRTTGPGLSAPQVEKVVNKAEANISGISGDEPFPFEILPAEKIKEPRSQDDPGAEKELADLLSEDPELYRISQALDAERRPDQFSGTRNSLSQTNLEAIRKTNARLSPDFVKTYNEEFRAAPTRTRSALGSIALKTIIKQTVKAGFAVIRRYMKSRHHGFYPTVFEEVARHLFVGTIGSQVWKFMKDDTADHFKTNRAGIGLLKKLNQLDSELDDGKRLRVTFVGHSAGCIFVCEFLKALADSTNNLNLPAVDVVFLAPAVDFGKFAETLDVAENHIRRFNMFTMEDRREKEDWLLGPFYPRSLLYLISGALEFSQADDLIVGMDRFHRVEEPGRKYSDDETEALSKVHEFLLKPKAECAWSVTASGADPGGQTAATKHGDFDNDELTLRSVVHLAKTV